MIQPTKAQEGYQTPIEQCSEQDNQQSGQEIAQGAAEEDQLDRLNENAPEGGRDEAKQAGAPPVNDEDINSGK